MGKSTVPLGMPEAMASLDRSCWSLGIKNNQVLRLGDFARAPLNCIHYHVRCLFNMIHETMFSNMNSEDHNIYIYIYIPISLVQCWGAPTNSCAEAENEAEPGAGNLLGWYSCGYIRWVHASQCWM